jgi:hypothetical protein
VPVESQVALKNIVNAIRRACCVMRFANVLTVKITNLWVIRKSCLSWKEATHLLQIRERLYVYFT